MTKEELIAMVDKYDEEYDEGVTISFHDKEYYALVYEKYGGTTNPHYENQTGIHSSYIYSHHYVVFLSEEDRDRYIREETFREFSDGNYKAEKITRQQLRKKGYEVKSPHCSYRYFDENGECVLGYTKEFQKNA